MIARRGSLETVIWGCSRVGSHDRDRSSRNDGSWDGFKFGSVGWDHYKGPVLRRLVGSDGSFIGKRQRGSNILAG